MFFAGAGTLFLGALVCLGVLVFVNALRQVKAEQKSKSINQEVMDRAFADFARMSDSDEEAPTER